MATYKSDLIQTLVARGYMHQCTDLAGLDAKAAREMVTAYIGFDATADSLHVGSLVQIMMLRVLQRTGHRPIALMGGGTSKVGDPSGKDEARKLLSDDDIVSNIAAIEKIFHRFFEFGVGAKSAVLANNAEWLDELRYIPFLREVGSQISVNRMLTMDSVKLRLDRDQPLSFLEFNYMILQAYDFVELNLRTGCTLQLGGADQWGNIVQGVDLGRRLAKAELYGFTTPLITTASGAKMGKTAAGAVWLTPEKLSPYDYYQYWRNTEDADVGRFLKLFTDLPLEEIAKLEKLKGAEINEAKKVLALEATRLLHGDEAAKTAADTAQRTFEKGELGAALPAVDVSAKELAKGIAVLDLIQRLGLAPSKSEARRLIRGGGAKLNDHKIDDENLTVKKDAAVGGVIKLSAGKKRIAVVRVVE
jgi:tyrosyl-tRNA synthetase